MITTILSYLSIVASICVAVCFYKKQKKYYNENMARLERARDFFLATPSYSVVTKGEDKIIDVSNLDGELLGLVNELNKYISRNKGTTDFSIIQNKTERFANTMFENASSNLAFPTYMGLMGTFVGVFMGLIGFVLPDFLREFGFDIVSDEEANITRLVYGVIVSMVTSFLGLYFTTQSNKAATEYKRMMDERKNMFYDFIQNELMPVLGMSVVAALSQLKETLLHFHESFDVITRNFERTFNSCTDKFGKEFEKNIVAVGHAASQLGSSIEVVNKNVENQQALLRELRSDGMIAALDRFVDAGRQFEQSTNSVKEMDNMCENISAAVKSLLTVQKEYNSSLVVPKLIAERLNVILERVTTFENSVNTLGASIAQTQMLGNSELTLIQEHLDNIKRKDAIAVEYQETANEELKALFDTETAIIQNLQHQYTSAIESHSDEFGKLMEQVAEAIKQKKEEFMQTLQDAFDMAELNTEFAHLKQLPEIRNCIDELNASVEKFRVLTKEHNDAEIGKLDTMKITLDSEARNVADMAGLMGGRLNLMLAKANTISSKVGDVKAIAENVAEKSDKTMVELKRQESELWNRLALVGDDLDILKKHAELTVDVNKADLQDVAKAIKSQQEEITALDDMIVRAKQDLDSKLVGAFRVRLSDLKKEIDAICSRVEGLKTKPLTKNKK